jgi:hypothetical protein
MMKESLQVLPLLQRKGDTGGQPSGESTRSFFEPGFGSGLSNVRMSEDSCGGGLAEASQKLRRSDPTSISAALGVES